MLLLIVVNLLWIALTIGHRLADHGSRDHLLWATVGRDEYLDEVQGVRGQHLLGFEADLTGLTRRVLFWRSFVLTELAFLGMYLASDGGVVGGIVTFANALLLTLPAWTTAGGKLTGTTARLATRGGYLVSLPGLIAAMWIVSIQFANSDDLILAMFAGTGALLATQLPKTLWDRLSATKPLDSGQVRTDGAVLWLRSFDDDKVKIRSRFAANELLSLVGIRTRFETLIATAAARTRNDLIAIGRPGERLRPTGAVRTYVPDSDWQRRVEQMVQESRAVFLVVGLSDGLAWEADTLIRLNAVPKTLFILPPLFVPAVEHRIERFLVSLGVPDREVREVDWSFPSILGFYVASTGHLGVVMADGRDDLNYALMIDRFVSSVEKGSLPSRPNLNSYANFANESLDTVAAVDVEYGGFSPSVRRIAAASLIAAMSEGRCAAVSDVWNAAVEDPEFGPILLEFGVDPSGLRAEASNGPNPLQWYSRFQPSVQWQANLTRPRYNKRAHEILLKASARSTTFVARPQDLLAALLDDGGVAAFELVKSGVDVEELRSTLDVPIE